MAIKQHRCPSCHLWEQAEVLDQYGICIDCMTAHTAQETRLESRSWEADQADQDYMQSEDCAAWYRDQYDEIADRLVTLFTDPTHPSNQLKRPARRTCVHCGETYRSRVDLLADSGVCADCLEVPTHVRLGITPAEALLRAIFGEL